MVCNLLGRWFLCPDLEQYGHWLDRNGTNQLPGYVPRDTVNRIPYAAPRMPASSTRQQREREDSHERYPRPFCTHIRGSYGQPCFSLSHSYKQPDSRLLLNAEQLSLLSFLPVHSCLTRHLFTARAEFVFPPFTSILDLFSVPKHYYSRCGTAGHLELSRLWHCQCSRCLMLLSGSLSLGILAVPHMAAAQHQRSSSHCTLTAGGGQPLRQLTGVRDLTLCRDMSTDAHGPQIRTTTALLRTSRSSPVSSVIPWQANVKPTKLL